MVDETRALAGQPDPAAAKQPAPLSDEDARAVLAALDPFWTRGIIRDPERQQPKEGKQPS
jgi:hypothetical protein